MGYAVSKGNSIQFTVDGEKLAFAVVNDEYSGYILGLFKQVNGEWQCPVWDNGNGIIDEGMTSEFIMRYGSVANFIMTRLPVMHDKLAKYLGHDVPKPDQSNKPECVGYDLAKDVDFDPVNLAFTLNKEPPLSHAR